MGDFARDTAVEGADGRYRASISEEWGIWGPCGGYVAAIAFRAGGAASRFARPVSFSCHYLGLARFEPVDLDVEVVRSGRTTESLRVTMTQDGRPIMEAMVLAVAEGHGDESDQLAHDENVMPSVAAPADLPTVDELLVGRDDVPRYPFWSNIESRAIAWREAWPPQEPLPARWLQWERFLPDATFPDDPWLDAARSVVWVDVAGWPAAAGASAYRRPPWVAVNVDLYVAFHQARPRSEYLLLDGHAHLAHRGLVGYTARTWSTDGALVASGGGQLLTRPASVVPDT